MLAVASRLGDSPGFSRHNNRGYRQNGRFETSPSLHRKMLAFKQISNPAKVRPRAVKKPAVLIQLLIN